MSSWEFLWRISAEKTLSVPQQICAEDSARHNREFDVRYIVVTDNGWHCAESTLCGDDASRRSMPLETLAHFVIALYPLNLANPNGCYAFVTEKKLDGLLSEPHHPSHLSGPGEFAYANKPNL